MSSVQVLPLPKVMPYWEHKHSRYPEVIKVSMSDGKVIRYVIDIEQPHPCFEAAMKNLERMETR